MKKGKITNDRIIDEIIYFICNRFKIIVISTIVVIGVYLGFYTSDAMANDLDSKGQLIEGGASNITGFCGILFAIMYVVFPLMLIIGTDLLSVLNEMISDWYERNVFYYFKTK